jgi:hypothetical protein
MLKPYLESVMLKLTLLFKKEPSTRQICFHLMTGQCPELPERLLKELRSIREKERNSQN